MMKTLIAGCAALALVGCEADGSGPGLEEVLGVIGATQGTTGIGGTSGYQLTAIDADAGLRQALTIGIDRVSADLGQTNGFFDKPSIRIPLPGTLGDIQGELQRIGLSAPLDDLQLRLNRAAEQAVPAGRDLIVEAVSSITLEDAIGLLRGGDTAATDFLRRKTEDQLRAAFRPYLENQLASVGAFSQLDSVTAQYGVGGIGSSLRSNLIDHGVQYGLDGLFNFLAQEEQKIRENPVARSTELLRKVFGAVD